MKTTKINLFLIAAMITAALLIFGCTTPQPPVPFTSVDDSGATTEGIKLTVSNNNAFALHFFNRFSYENGMISPWSISSALAMTYEGAKGETATQMRDTMKYPSDAQVMRSSFARLYNVINKSEKNYLLSTANALWGDNSITFEPEYLSVNDKYYGSNLSTLDFQKDPENSRITINSWVENKTNGKIKDLIPSGMVTSDTRLVLTNAIYFKGKWNNEFKKEATTDQDFFVKNTIVCTQCLEGMDCPPCPTNGGAIKVPMMHANDNFNYYEDDSLQALELPYKDKELSMIVFLPKMVEEYNYYYEVPYEFSKNPSYYESIVSSMSNEEVIVSLPKFKFEKSYLKMADDLRREGMQLAMSDSADFSGITADAELKISAVVHKTFIEVNEEGTEAAAATGVIMVPTSAMPSRPPKEFTADHEFMFVIKENSTGQILFMGTVSDPSKN